MLSYTYCKCCHIPSVNVALNLLRKIRFPIIPLAGLNVTNVSASPACSKSGETQLFIVEGQSDTNYRREWQDREQTDRGNRQKKNRVNRQTQRLGKQNRQTERIGRQRTDRPRD